ncbi:MAG: bestrophin family protein [Acetobacteraceae bacterium]
MIVRPRPTAFGLWFIVRGSVVPTILPRLLAVTALSTALAVVHRIEPGHFRDLTPAPFTLLGLALSIFLGFRNNACYERWWEARRQWGQLIAEIRGLVREGMAVLPDPALAERFARRGVAFAHALRDQLRQTGGTEIASWLPPGEWATIAGRRSWPDAIQRAQTADLKPLVQRGELSDILYRDLSERLQAMTNIQTACERLSTTPTPFTYTLLLHRTAWLFCVLLPFGLVDSLGMTTPIATLILAYAFFGLDALGEELEEPFTPTQNGIPLDAMVRTIEIAVLEGLGQTDVPPPLQPKDFVLH